MKSFFFSMRRFLDVHELILTGEQLTPDFHLPARFRLDARSRKLTGMTEVEVLNLEIVEDSPPVNVFPARQEAEKQAPKPVVKPKRKPKPINDRLHSVSHPNPYKDKSPACVIHAADMARKQAEILTTLETMKKIQR